MTTEVSLLVDGPDAPLSGRDVAPRTAGGLGARGAIIAVGVLISIAVAVALFIGGGPESESAGDVARMAPAFSLPALREGDPEVKLSATASQPTVVNFFAAWCEPCKRELPALRAAAAANPGIAFVGIDHQDSREDALDLLGAMGIEYPAGYDPQGNVAARYGVRGLPATAFISPDGRMVDFHQGELSAKEIQQRLDRLTLKKPDA